MKLPHQRLTAFTLVEIMVTTSIIGVVGLIIFSLLNTGLILGAKNTAVNTAHQQARIAMMRMLQDLHSTVSQPYLIDTSYNQVATTSAAGISFQTWWGGPYQIVADSTTSQNTVHIYYAASGIVPDLTGKRLIIETHEIEDDIVSNTTSDPNDVTITLANNLPTAISNTASYNIAGFITERASYCVIGGELKYTRSGVTVSLGSGITNPSPFSIPTGAGGSSVTGVVSAVNLSTSDYATSNRGFKSANILLNQQIPSKAKLTTLQ
jgi:type II secretory pathway pseudopilin PulG